MRVECDRKLNHAQKEKILLKDQIQQFKIEIERLHKELLVMKNNESQLVTELERLRTQEQSQSEQFINL
jgi:hypothetical protein